MNAHDHVQYIASGAAARAAVEFDAQIFNLMKDNGLEELFTDAINAMDPEALIQKGYMLVHTTDSKPKEHGLGEEITHTVRLVKILDDAVFQLDFSVDLSAVKMKEPK